MAEFLPGGGIRPYWRIEPVRLLTHLNRLGINAGWKQGVIAVTYSYEFYLGERQDLTLPLHQGSIILLFPNWRD